MKIGIDISQIAYPGTGTEAYTNNLVKALIDIDEKNNYVFFASSLRRNKHISDFINSLSSKDNFETKSYRLPQSFLTWLWNIRHIVSIDKFIGKVDLFHTSDWLEPPCESKKITTIHDLLVYKFPDFMDKRIVTNQINKLKWVVKESDSIIADSYSTKADIVNYLKIPEKKIRVIYLGVDKRFRYQSKEKIELVKNKYNIRQEYLLCVGTNNPRKNLSRIMAAFNLLNNSDLQLVMVGNYGWGKKIVKQNSVKQINYINQEDMPALYSGARMFVYPSLYEGFGLPVLEAMACKTPVIASNRGSLKEISGNFSIKVDPESVASIKSGIVEILNLSEEKKQKLAQLGSEYAQNFLWEKCARETLALYNEL